MSNQSVDFEFIEKQYFYFDANVPYRLSDGTIIEITPVSIMDSEIFMSSIDIFMVDKNSLPDPKIIQMSYLQFLAEVILQQDIQKQAMLNLCQLCLGIEYPIIYKNDFGKYFLTDKDEKCVISAKQFDEIRTIILKQNLLDYDDEYINPELKKALDETKRLKNKNLDIPTLERKIAIITSHCGVTKMEQLKMTMRSHAMLFREVCDEVEYTTTAPVAMIGGKGKELEHWIFKRKKQRFDGEVISVSDFNRASGGTGEVSSIMADTNKNPL